MFERMVEMVKEQLSVEDVEITMETSFNGLEITPNLNKLASEGMYFTNYYAQESNQRLTQRGADHCRHSFHSRTCKARLRPFFHRRHS